MTPILCDYSIAEPRYLQKYQPQLSDRNTFNQHDQWKDFDQVTTNDPPEGERGLAATLVGGGGVSTKIFSSILQS
jgi:hypothetical protein